MRIWTTQSEEVIDILLRDTVYRPDFSMSHVSENGYMKDAYEGILEEYQIRNDMECQGLVFGIAYLGDKVVESIEQYRDYFKNDKTFWDSVSMAGSNYAVLELEVPDNLNLLPIYYQDYIVLGMRVTGNSAFREHVKPKLKDRPFRSFAEDYDIAQQIGWTGDEKDANGRSVFHRIVQSYLHEISMDNVKGVYETYNFDEECLYPLGANAEKLRNMVE